MGWGTVVNIAVPVLGAVLIPGAGGLVGAAALGAAGSALGGWADGESGLGDIGNNALTGAVGGLLGGVAGKVLFGSVPKIVDGAPKYNAFGEGIVGAWKNRAGDALKAADDSLTVAKKNLDDLKALKLKSSPKNDATTAAVTKARDDALAAQALAVSKNARAGQVYGFLNPTTRTGRAAFGGLVGTGATLTTFSYNLDSEPKPSGKWIGACPAENANPDFNQDGKGHFLFQPDSVTQSIDDWYLKLASSLCTAMANSGGSSTEPVAFPAIPAPTEAGGGDGGVANYGTSKAALTNAQKNFNVIEASLLATGKKTEATVEQYKANIGTLITQINTAAQSFTGKDGEFLLLISEAFAAIQGVTDAAAQEAAKQGTELDEQTKALLDRMKALETNQQTALDQVAQNPVQQLPTSNYGAPYDPYGVSPITTPNVDPASQSALDGTTPGTGSLPSAITPASAVSPVGAAGAGMGMNDMMNQMMQQMMMQQMMENQMRQMDDDMYQNGDELADRQAALEQTTAAVPLAQAPHMQAAQPAAAQPGQQQTAQQTSMPTGTSAPGGTNGTQTRVPDEDGAVTYTFPDGRTQKVSPVVAAALDKAFGNKGGGAPTKSGPTKVDAGKAEAGKEDSGKVEAGKGASTSGGGGTDAKAAYEGTPAAWENDKEIGDRVDPYQLITGDVAKWEDRSALLVAFGTEAGDPLEAIVDAELKTFAPEMTDAQGEMGPFVGFFHPKGIEITAKGKPAATQETSADAAGATDQSAQQSLAAPAMPAAF